MALRGVLRSIWFLPLAAPLVEAAREEVGTMTVTVEARGDKLEIRFSQEQKYRSRGATILVEPDEAIRIGALLLEAAAAMKHDARQVEAEIVGKGLPAFDEVLFNALRRSDVGGAAPSAEPGGSRGEPRSEPK